MDCSNCGGSLSAGLAWCPRCYTPVLGAIVRPAVPERDEYPDDLRIEPAWTSWRMPKPDPAHEPVYSRWHGSETTFGLVGRVGITVGMIAAAVVAIPILLNFADDAGRPAYAFVMFWGAVLVAAAVLVLTQVWRRGRIH